MNIQDLVVALEAKRAEHKAGIEACNSAIIAAETLKKLVAHTGSSNDVTPPTVKTPVKKRVVEKSRVAYKTFAKEKADKAKKVRAPRHRYGRIRGESVKIIKHLTAHPNQTPKQVAEALGAQAPSERNKVSIKMANLVLAKRLVRDNAAHTYAVSPKAPEV